MSVIYNTIKSEDLLVHLDSIKIFIKNFNDWYKSLNPSSQEALKRLYASAIGTLSDAKADISAITAEYLVIKAKEIAEKYSVDSRKSASILDTFSCVLQGIIPYGAQLLIAAKLASLSPLSIIEYLYYPMGFGIMALLSILLRYPKKYS